MLPKKIKPRIILTYPFKLKWQVYDENRLYLFKEKKKAITFCKKLNNKKGIINV